MSIIQLFSPKPREIGDQIKVQDRQGKSFWGIVIGKCEDNPKYQNANVHDVRCKDNNRTVNNGKGYYEVKIK